MVDLHTHSTVSDGSDPPARIPELAAAAGCTAVALTDHDRLDGLAEARARAEALGVECKVGLATRPVRVVILSAGLVFAFTMMTMAVSQLTVIGQVGTTIGLGLLFDTLIVRSLMTPSIAALLGKWFWWPQRVRQRPVPSPWPTPAKTEKTLATASPR